MKRLSARRVGPDLFVFSSLVAAVALLTALEAQARAAGPTVSYTRAQADSGRVEFLERCSECHAHDLTGGEGPQLNGGMFRADFGGKPVKELLSFVQESMPRTSPGSLDPASVARLVAYLLSANGVPAGTQPLSPTSTAMVPSLRRPR